MAKNDIDILSHAELDKALSKVDKVIMRKYVSDIDKRPIFLPTYDVSFEPIAEPDKPIAEADKPIAEADKPIAEADKPIAEPDKPIADAKPPVCIVGTNIMLSKLTRVVYDKDENVLDKLTTAYCATAMYESATLVMLLKSDGKNIDVYLGTVCKKSDDSFLPKKQISALISNFKANFPGSEIVEIDNVDERMKIVQSIFEKKLCVSAVTGIAALKHDEYVENVKYVQGLEKLADSLKGKVCTVMIIADPVGAKERHAIRAGYEELYSALKPFEKSEYSVNANNGKTVTDSIIKGVTDTTNESIAKTQTHTITKGTNSSHTVGGSVGVNASATATAGFSAAPFGVGPNASASVTVGTSVSADYHYMKGHHEDNSEAEGTSETTGTSKSLSEQNSIANALSSSKGEGLQITYENRSVKSIIEKIDLQIERIADCDDYGMFDCGVYFLSDDYTTCLSVASTYKSIIQGEHSSVETSHISIWDDKTSIGLIPYLSTFNHPVFDLAETDGEKASATASTLVSGRELAIYMGLPTQCPPPRQWRGDYLFQQELLLGRQFQ